MGGGDPKIAALSTSWGTCESEFSRSFAFPHDSVAAVGNIMKSLTAAGVTVFAASGDAGIYDCGDAPKSTKVAVDYPASDPRVVGVGGTRLKFVGNSAANDGTNWLDTTWKCVSAETCQGSKAADTGGSGGGASTLFKQPAYQSLGLGHAPFTTSTGKKGDFGAQRHRLVPDIAADGDPATGFATMTSDPVDDPCTNPIPPLCAPSQPPVTLGIGGTSLSAPAAAAMFTDMLAIHGATAGVGDIHPALYAAYASHRGVFRDITKGRNGSQADVDARAAKKQAAELPVTAGKGYDTATGLGAVLWSALAPFVFSPQAPSAKIKVTLATPHSRKHPTRVRASWTAVMPKRNGSLASAASVTITKAGAATPVFSSTNEPPTGSTTFKGASGATYQATVTEQNLAGLPAAPSTSSIAVPYDDSAFTFHGKWHRVKGKSDFGGTREVSSTRGNFAKVTATGSVYIFTARTGPTYGKVSVFRHATKLGEFDLYSVKASHRSFTFYGSASTASKSRTFRLYVTGRKNPFSTGKAVDLDAFLVV
jgi:hypothetical protein